MDLPSSDQKAVLKKINETAAWARWPVPYVLQPAPEPRNTLALHWIARAAQNAASFPRLVRAWPGESRRVLPVPDVAQSPLGLKEWPPRRPLYKAILSLEETAKLRFHDGTSIEQFAFEAKTNPDMARERLAGSGLHRFMADVLKIAESYSLLNYETGDTVWDWYNFYREIVYLSEARKGLLAEAERLSDSLSIDAAAWSKKTDSGAFEATTVKRSKKKWPIYAPFSPNPIDKYHMTGTKTLGSIRKEFTDSCRVRGLRGSVRWSPSGVGLEVGGQQWALVELAETFNHGQVRFCVACGEPLEGRRQRQTCGATCRSRKQRGKTAVTTGISGS